MTEQPTKIDPKALFPGTVVRHSSGGTVTLARRKRDDSGWWNTDGSGLSDVVWKDGSWSVVDQPSVGDVVNVLLHKALASEPCKTACTHVVAGQWTALGIANVVDRAVGEEGD